MYFPNKLLFEDRLWAECCKNSLSDAKLSIHDADQFLVFRHRYLAALFALDRGVKENELISLRSDMKRWYAKKGLDTPQIEENIDAFFKNT